MMMAPRGLVLKGQAYGAHPTFFGVHPACGHILWQTSIRCMLQSIAHGWTEGSDTMPIMPITTNITMPDEVYEQYETLSQSTGRTRDALMIEALHEVAEQKLREIAMIQEGLEQARQGHAIPIEDVVARFKAEGMLPADFVLGTDEG